MNSTGATVRTITRWIAAAAAVWAMAVLCGQLPGATAGAAEPRADDVLPRALAPRGPATLADLVEQGRGSAAMPGAVGEGPFTPPAAGPRKPIPPVDQLTLAQRLLEEVFGKRLAAAKTPAEKGKLAREMIEAVRGEPDEAARYAALVQARILAVEARDGRLALSAVRLLAGEFESDAGAASDAERLARADRLWAEAEKAEGKQRLEKQLEAVGEYWRANDASGIRHTLWRKRAAAISGLGESSKTLRVFSGTRVAIIHKKSGLAINVYKGAKIPGATLVLWSDPSSNPNATWFVEVDEDGFCAFRNCETGLYLSQITGSASQSERGPFIWWDLRQSGRQSVYLVNGQSWMTPKPRNAATEQGTPVWLYPFEGTDCEEWILQKMP